MRGITSRVKQDWTQLKAVINALVPEKYQKWARLETLRKYRYFM